MTVIRPKIIESWLDIEDNDIYVTVTTTLCGIRGTCVVCGETTRFTVQIDRNSSLLRELPICKECIPHLRSVDNNLICATRAIPLERLTISRLF